VLLNSLAARGVRCGVLGIVAHIDLAVIARAHDARIGIHAPKLERVVRVFYIKEAQLAALRVDDFVLGDRANVH
jgi:hypothetical protein